MSTGGLIRAGGAFIDLILDKVNAMQGLKEFEVRFRSTMASLNKLGFGSNFGFGLSTNVGRGLSSSIANFFNGNTFSGYFFKAGKALTDTVKDFFTGSFFERLSQGFRRAGQSLTFTGLLFSTILGGLSAALTGPLREFSKAEQLTGRFAAVFRDLTGEAEQFAEVLAKDINQSVFELKDEMATFQGIFLGAGWDPRRALELSKMFVEMSQDLLAYDDSLNTAEEATKRLEAGLSGMVIPVQRFGADIREASLEQELLKRGINETTNSLTQQERQLLRTTKILEAMTAAGILGQARREVNTLAAVFRGSGAAAKVAAIAIGDALAPAAQVVLRTFTVSARAFAKWAQANKTVIVGAGLTIVALSGMGSAFVALGISAFAASAALRVMAGTMAILVAPAIAVVAAFRTVGVLIGGAVVAFQAAAAGVGLLFRQLSAATAMAAGVWQLTTALLGMSVALGKIAVTSAVNALARVGRYFAELATVAASAAYAMAISVASTTRALYAFAAITVKTVVVGLLAMTARTVAAAQAMSVLFMNMSRVVAVTAGGALMSFGLMLKTAAVAAGALVAVLAKGLVAAAGAAVTGLWTLATTGVAAFASLTVTLLNVLAPMAAVALALGGIATVFIAIKPKALEFARSIFAAGGAADQVFGRMKEAGKGAVDVLGRGFELLRSDARQAFSGIADALRAGDITLAAKILWATLQLEFATGWATIVPMFQEFGLALAITANNMWSQIVTVFHDGYRQIAQVGMALSQLFVAIMTPVASAVSAALGWISSLFEGTAGEMSALWSSNENWLLQITDLMRDAFSVTANFILGLWDDITGAIEKAWIWAKSLADESINVKAEFDKVDEQNRLRAEGRQDNQNEEIMSRETERKRASKAINDERKRIQEEIEAKRLEREKNLREMFGNLDENANARLEEQTRQWDELLDQAARARNAENNKPPGESVLDGWRERIQKLMEDVGFGGEEAATATRRSEAAFADVARFGLGTTTVEEKQLRELMRIRKAAERDRPAGARAGA